jgi:RNA polymerase sigma-70 factor (ECF subfamily)
MTLLSRNSTLPLLEPDVSRAEPGDRVTALELEIIGLFDQLRNRTLRYAIGFGLSMADAEEIVQEVFLALYQHLLRGKSRDSLPAWVFKVTHNLSLKRRLALSRNLSRPMTTEAEMESVHWIDPSPNPEDQVADRQRQDCLRSVMSALPETDRQVLSLRAEGLRYREISDVLGISVGGVANSLARSLARLSAVDERFR